MTRSLWESWAELGPRLPKAHPLLACFDYDSTDDVLELLRRIKAER